MKKIYLKVPSVQDLHYRKGWMADASTMAYNAGYDLDMPNYDYQTGTITKSDEELLVCMIVGSTKNLINSLLIFMIKKLKNQ